MFPIFRANYPSIICCLFHFFLHYFYVTSDVFQIPYSCGPGSVLSVPLSLSVYWFILKVSKPHCLNYCVNDCITVPHCPFLLQRRTASLPHSWQAWTWLHQGNVNRSNMCHFWTESLRTQVWLRWIQQPGSWVTVTCCSLLGTWDGHVYVGQWDIWVGNKVCAFQLIRFGGFCYRR